MTPELRGPERQGEAASSTAPVPSTFPRVITAIVVPPIMGAIFVPIFRSVQSQGRPTGTLDEVDLTSFAERDERMVLYFACILALFVIGIGIGSLSLRRRLAVILVAAVAAFASYVAVFASLFVG